MGEPAGIGGEIALKAWLQREQAQVPPFFVIDDVARLGALAATLGLPVPIQSIDTPSAAASAFTLALPVMPRPLPVPVTPGHPDPRNNQAVIAAIETAVAIVRRGLASAVVTNPIHKKVLYDSGFGFAGHTEFLAALAGFDVQPVMMLVCPELKVVPVTVHVSLRQAVETLRTGAIVHAGLVTATALERDFGVRRPRLAVAGVNPHAGEDGAMGDEDGTVVSPAVDILCGHGIDAFGPLPPDTLFSPHVRRGYDAALCMYHDQALIPLKALDFDGGVNVTLGLPFIRTSPDHGTALDIAGSGRANAASLVAALRLAGQLAARRSRSST
jgi:4-hydroxythreonine-4-phosphate dehydrogenase